MVPIIYAWKSRSSYSATTTNVFMLRTTNMESGYVYISNDKTHDGKHMHTSSTEDGRVPKYDCMRVW